MKKTYKRFLKRPMRAWSFCAASCLCGISTTLAQETAPATEKPEKSEEPVKKESEYRNWFDVSVGHNFVSGKESTFQERHGTPANQTFGGVSDFHYEQDVGKKGLFEVDGRGIFDNHDYSLRLNIQNPDIGYLRGGYQEFRTYYDGSAGYLPLIDRQFTLYNEDFFVDRGEFWLEGGLTLPNRPEFTFRYSHQFREGQKDSTSWGDTSLGLPAGQSRNIVPSFLDIDEERDIFQLDASHTLANTHFGAGLRYEIDQEENSRNMRRSPLQPADRYLTQREDVDTDLFNVHAFQETRFSDEILFTTGYSFTTLDTDLGGSRIYGADYDSIYDPLFARRQQRDEGFFDLAGGSRVDQHVMNLNFMLTPWENFTIVPSLRAELQEQEGLATVQETNVGAPPALASVIESIENTRTRDFVDVSEGLEVRYTGITNWVLYARAELLEGDGSLKEISNELDDNSVRTVVERDTDSSRFTQKYIVGANWYPARQVNLAAQYYFKSRKNDYDHLIDTTTNAPPSGDRYPAFIRDQDFDTHDLNFRITWRPFSTLTFITRYDFQLSTINSRMDFLSEVQSAEATTHIFGESITWVPWSRLYLQAGVNYAIDNLDTPADDQVPGLVQRSDNNYINGTATAGFVLTEKTDLQASYFVYYSNNYDDNSAVSTPYLASAEEHGITGTVIHRFTPAQQLTVKYGWFTNSDKTYGGRNDYEAHMIHASYRYRF
jgi:hypothetical protein